MNGYINTTALKRASKINKLRKLFTTWCTFRNIAVMQYCS